MSAVNERLMPWSITSARCAPRTKVKVLLSGLSALALALPRSPFDSPTVAASLADERLMPSAIASAKWAPRTNVNVLPSDPLAVELVSCRWFRTKTHVIRQTF